VYRGIGLDGLDLDNDATVHQQINTRAAVKSPSIVLQWQRLLAVVGDPPESQLMIQAVLGG